MGVRRPRECWCLWVQVWASRGSRVPRVWGLGVEVQGSRDCVCVGGGVLGCVGVWVQGVLGIRGVRSKGKGVQGVWVP